MKNKMKPRIHTKNLLPQNRGRILWKVPMRNAQPKISWLETWYTYGEKRIYSLLNIVIYGKLVTFLERHLARATKFLNALIQ